MEWFNILLASGLISALTSYFVSIRLKNQDFKNAYYKEIIKKRLNAYTFIENQISAMKGVILGDDNRPYHFIFGQGELKFLEYHKDLLIAISLSLWIDDKTVEKLQDINDIFFTLINKVHNKSNDEIEEIGKEYYQKISDLRFELEQTAKTGLYQLHDMKKAFKGKRKNTKRKIKEK